MKLNMITVSAGLARLREHHHTTTTEEARMGRYGIGARVRDEDGDEGVIIDKRKGERKVAFENDLAGVQCWLRKDELTAIEPAPFKVGDRVKFNTNTPAFGAIYFDGVMTVKWATEDEVSIDYPPFGDWTDVTLNQVTDVACLELVTEPTLALRAGGYYKLRNGEVVGPLVANDHHLFVFTVEVRSNFADSWTSNGAWFGDEEEPRDIVEEVPAPVAAATPTLTIEAGKFYRTRDGRKVGPAFVSGDIATFGNPNNHASAVWVDNGRQSHRNDLTTELASDIVAEWVDEPKPQPKFKKGDRVICIDNAGAPRGFETGKVYVVDRVEPKDDDFDDADLIYCVDAGGMYDYRFAPAPTDFQVGDVVRVKAHVNWSGHSIDMDAPLGSEQVVTKICEPYRSDTFTRVEITNGGKNFYTDTSIELVRRPPAAPVVAPAFPIGTEVVIRGRVTGINSLNRSVVVEGANDTRVGYDFPISTLKAA